MGKYFYMLFCDNEIHFYKLITITKMNLWWEYINVWSDNNDINMHVVDIFLPQKSVVVYNDINCVLDFILSKNY